MKQQVTYGQLGVILSDIETQVANSPAFELFNREKIKRFHMQNAIRIKVYQETKHKLFTENIKVDETGKYFAQTEVDGKKDWDYISDDHKKSFTEATEKFMSLTFDINL